MKKYNIHSVRTRAYKMTTNSKHNKPVSPNLLKNPDLKIDASNTVWGVTYIPTQEGWLYHAIVKDLYTKKVVGYTFSDNSELVCLALNMAVLRRRPKSILIFHSDRGVRLKPRFVRKIFDNSIDVTQRKSLRQCRA